MEELILETIADFFTDEKIKSKILESEVDIKESGDWTWRRVVFDETFIYITITCSDPSVVETLKKSESDLIDKLLEINLGKNYNGVPYFPSLEIKKGVKNKRNKGTTEISFEDFEAIIIKNLRKAKFYIWVAVAWVTNPKIIEELNKKALEGLNVQVLLNDDYINEKSDKFFKSNINLQIFKVKVFGYYSKNQMHNKFCIIDGETILNGSNNWSNKAEFNNENIMIISGDKEKAEKYQAEFIRIKKEHRLNI